MAISSTNSIQERKRGRELSQHIETFEKRENSVEGKMSLVQVCRVQLHAFFRKGLCRTVYLVLIWSVLGIDMECTWYRYGVYLVSIWSGLAKGCA